jgi:NAD(P)-dependent dehydrogenase (short-subunit alcohol dehydrogenase family)
MVKRNKGRFILLSSMHGKLGTKDAASYSVSKWGILGLGLVDTPLTRYETRFVEGMGETGQKPPDHPTPQEAWDVRAPTVPLRVGWLQPDDISPAAVFLASDAANMVTGAEYEVTGGEARKTFDRRCRSCP